MKYIKKYNEDIEWVFDEDETYELKEIPYVKDGISYGSYLSLSPNIRSKMKFNLENKVICTSERQNYYDIIDEIGHVVDFDNFEKDYLIFFNNYIEGHSCNGIPYGHGWWVSEDKLEKYTD